MKKYFIKQKKELFVCLFLIISVSLLNTFLALVTKELVDAGTIKDIEKFKNMFLIAGVIVVSFLITEYLKKVSINNLLKKWSLDLKNDVFNKLIQRQPKDFNSNSSGEYISTLTNDVNMIKDAYFVSVIALIQTSVQFIITSYTLFKLNISIGLAIIVFSILPILIPKITERCLAEKKEFQSKKISAFTSKIKDIFEGFHVIKSFNIHDRINKEFRRVNYETEDSICKYRNYNSLVNILAGFCAYGMLLACLAIGTYLVIKQEITVGVLIAAIQLMEIIDMAVLDFTYEIIDLKSIKLVKNKVTNIIKEEISSENGIEKEVFNSSIEFKDVCFSYDNNKEILKNISFSIEKGKKYAIVGQSGSGKSTLLNLLLQFNTNYTGNIYIDGIDSKKIKLSNIYKLISVIHQDVFMFDSSINDNICLYGDYSNKALSKALEVSKLIDVINGLPNGLDSHVGENGSKLSGGEKQRISIARAMIKNTPILLLDEPTSSLDNETSTDIENSILKLSDVTAAIVTHKLSVELLKKYDSIVVMKDGYVKEIGTFQELINNRSYFYNLITIESDFRN